MIQTDLALSRHYAVLLCEFGLYPLPMFVISLVAFYCPIKFVVVLPLYCFCSSSFAVLLCEFGLYPLPMFDIALAAFYCLSLLWWSFCVVFVPLLLCLYHALDQLWLLAVYPPSLLVLPPQLACRLQVLDCFHPLFFLIIVLFVSLSFVLPFSIVRVTSSFVSLSMYTI